jgi:hypothetical protein
MPKTAFYLCFFALLSGGALLAQTTSQTSFGKNRVQYSRQIDEWMLYETPNLITYWYGDARNVAQSALQIAEMDFAAVQQLLEHQMSEKIEVLVFSDLSDLKQSNIGETELFQTRNRETKVVGNKVFVYFDGDHRHLQAQIREGIAGVLLNAMLFGSNLQEIVQNAVLLNLPGWYTDGLTAYCGEEWNVELDNRLRDLLQSGRYRDFDKLAKDHPRLAGHAFWYYIGLHFGRGTVSNLLYLTRINRSIDAGFLYVLGNGYRRTTESMLDYFGRRYREEAQVTRPPAGKNLQIRNKKKLPLYQARLSPDGKRIAWVSNNMGRWKVWVKDLKDKDAKPKKVLAGGTKNALQTTDYNYPLLAWNPDNQRLAVMYERRDVVRLAACDLKTGKKEKSDLSPEFQRVYSMSYANPNELLFSGAVRGYTDLFLYRSITRQTERLTQDFWDDLDATVVTLDGRKSVLFASNRLSDTLRNEKLDTILPLNRFDIFCFDLESRSPELQRLTRTPLADERNPVALDSAHFAYLSDENGITNRQVGYLEDYLAYNQATIFLKDGSEVKALDTQRPGEWPAAKALVFLAPLDTVLKNVDSLQIDSIRFQPVLKKRPKTWNQTNYDRNILEQHVAPRVGQRLELVPRAGRTDFLLQKIAPQQNAPVRITRFRELTLRAAGMPIPPQPDIEEGTRRGQPDAPPRPGDETPAPPTQQERSDTLRNIEPGWLFVVPEHLRAPAPNAPAAKTEAPRLAQRSEEEPYGLLEPDSIPMPRRPLKTTGPSLEFGKPDAVLRFYPSQITPYRLKFRTDFIATSFDNNLLFEGLDSYAGTQPGLRNPPIGILMRANFKDLLENYVIEAGFRLPTTFNGAEYYLWFDNKKYRLDRRIALYRRSEVNAAVEPTSGSPALRQVQIRNKVFLAQYELRYPLDAFFSLRSTLTLRQDKADSLSTDIVTLDASTQREQRAALRLSAVYDNTVDVDHNIKTGSRAKISVESVKRLAFNIDPSWSLRFNKGFMTVLSLDARHYQPLDRRTVFCARLAAATSFGSERMLYYLGGVDNGLFPSFNNNIPIPQDGNFAFEALATNLRGFPINIRNGNSFVLLNTELRIPIFKYLSKKPVLGNFWRNFQLTGFFDVGTAWQGRTPYGGNNPINTVVLTEGPVNRPPIVIMKVNYFRDPLVGGYGVGLRTMLFGMYLRADYGWGIETRVVQKPRLHLALGTDF